MFLTQRCFPHSTTGSPARAVQWAAWTIVHSIVGAGYVHAQTNLGNIMPLGDSITVGDGSPATPGGYRDPLYSLLTNASDTFTYVGSETTNPTALLTAAGETNHEGHAGATIAPVSIAFGGSSNDLQSNVANWIPAADPNYILLMIGTNNVDLSYPTNFENGPYDPSLLANAGANLATLIDTISNKLTGLASDAHLIVSNIIWIGIPAENAGVQQYDAQVLSDVQTAQAAGENVSFCDMYDQVPPTLNDKSDDLHPNAYGYQLMAQGWFNAIQSVQAQPNVVSAGTSLNLTPTTGLPSNGTIFNDGMVSVAGGSSAAPITVGNFAGGGSLAIGSGDAAGFLQLSSSSGASTVGSLTISTGSTLDITNNTVFINYGSAADPISAINSYLATGAIISSTVTDANATQTAVVYAVGSADGADGIVSGLSSGPIEIMPTLAGDAKLQGTVNFGDFQLLVQYFGHANTSWDEGDFTYSGTTNFGDFQLLAQDFGSISTALSAGTSTGLSAGNSSAITASEIASLNRFAARFGDTLVARADGVGFNVVSVPEPVGTAALALAGMVALRRRGSGRAGWARATNPASG
jgi:lysophospholipase L1-like esterase